MTYYIQIDCLDDFQGTFLLFGRLESYHSTLSKATVLKTAQFEIFYAATL